MKENTERKIRNRRISIVLMEYVVTLGCLFVAFVMFVGKERIKQVNSYAKPEEITKYEVKDEYLTRVRPLTKYDTFIYHPDILPSFLSCTISIRPCSFNIDLVFTILSLPHFKHFLTYSSLAFI
jgi:hypothetical protein